MLGTVEQRHEHNESIYEEVLHPNNDKSTIVENSMDISRRTYLLGDEKEPGSFPNSAFAKWFAQFDEHSIRPFLIRNYTLEAVETMDALNQIMTKNFDDKEPDAVEHQL